MSNADRRRSMGLPPLGDTSSSQEIVFFFFSSRRRHTRFDCDWSSDVCSSDLVKNSINAFGKKNFLGTFAPPAAVINDLSFLATLSDREWRSGIAEAIKVTLLKEDRKSVV